MRIARFSHDDVPQYAFVQYDEAEEKDYLVALDGYPLGGSRVNPTGERYALDADGIRLLAPIIPSKIYGLAKNYEAHTRFMHEAGRSDIAHAPGGYDHLHEAVHVADRPRRSDCDTRCDHDMNYEPEVAVVIGRIAKNVPAERAMDYVLGFTCTNDVTLRDLQKLDPMWTRAKGFDTACPLGPWIQTELDWRDARISFSLNGKDVPEASGTTANLIHSIPEQIAAISSYLLPRDPDRNPARLRPGDVEGIGSLRNVVVPARRGFNSEGLIFLAREFQRRGSAN